jgi:hypothetical protein
VVSDRRSLICRARRRISEPKVIGVFVNRSVRVIDKIRLNIVVSSMVEKMGKVGSAVSFGGGRRR